MEKKRGRGREEGEERRGRKKGKKKGEEERGRRKVKEEGEGERRKVKEEGEERMIDFENERRRRCGKKTAGDEEEKKHTDGLKLFPDDGTSLIFEVGSSLDFAVAATKSKKPPKTIVTRKQMSKVVKKRPRQHLKRNWAIEMSIEASRLYFRSWLVINYLPVLLTTLLLQSGGTEYLDSLMAPQQPKRAMMLMTAPKPMRKYAM